MNETMARERNQHRMLLTRKKTHFDSYLLDKRTPWTKDRNVCVNSVLNFKSDHRNECLLGWFFCDWHTKHPSHHPHTWNFIIAFIDRPFNLCHSIANIHSLVGSAQPHSAHHLIDLTFILVFHLITDKRLFANEPSSFNAIYYCKCHKWIWIQYLDCS